MKEKTWQQDINRTSLAVARQNVGLTTIEATRRVIAKNSKGIDRVQLWESGQTNPTYRQLEKLAQVYNVNPLQLLLDEDLGPTKPPVAFRTNKKIKGNSYNLSRFISTLRMRQAIIADNLRRDNTPKHDLVGSGRQHKDPRGLAELIRQKIDYDISQKPAGQDTLKYLRSLLHDRFVFVFKTMSTSRDVIDPDEMRGMYLHNDHAPFIALNRRDHKASQLFSLAHELAHLFRAEEKVDSIEFRTVEQTHDPKESFCNQVAACLLIPRNKIESRNGWSLGNVKDLAKANQVSSLVALYRLDGLEQIDRQTTIHYSGQLRQEYEDYQASKSQDGDRKQRGNYNNNMIDSNGQLFDEFVFSLHLDGRLSAVEAQNLLKLPLTKV